jgi:hypothetical protein
LHTGLKWITSKTWASPLSYDSNVG